MRFPTLQRDVLWLATLLWLLPVYGYSQSEKHSRFINNQKNIKIGLALSGGGAKGFAHIGLLKVFEKEGIPVNMISGTSMGAIIGSLYAIGYTPEQIEDIVLSTDWGILFNDSYRINPQNIASSVSSKPTYLITFPFNDRKLQLPSGLIDGQNISMLLYRLMLPYHNVQDFTELPIPFSAVATDLSTGQAHTFTKGYLPDAVRASSAIPTIFKPVKVDGSTYIDGGVARNIPAEDVRKLGADLVISSDVGEPVKPVDSLHTFVDILFQSVGFHQQESNKKQIQNSDFYIHPDIQDFSSFSYDHAKEIIRKGEEAAHKLVPLIKSFLNEHHAHVSSSPFKSISSPQNDTLLITNIRFANINGLLKKQVNVTLNIKIPSRLTLHTIEKKINRLYNSGLFSQISYRIQYDSTSRVDGHQLLLKFQQKEQEYVGFSVRYDSQYKAALLFGASLTDNLFWSDRLNTRLRIGEILELAAQYSVPLTIAPLSKLNLELDFKRSPIDFYQQEQALSTINVEQLSLQPFFSVRLLDRLDIETGAEAQVYSLNEAVGNTLVLENTSFLLTPFLRMGYNTFNHPTFPSRGQSLNVKALASDRDWGSTATFFQISGNWGISIPLLKGVAFNNTLFAGYTSGSEIPLHYNYYLGGIAPNPVFNTHQRPFLGYATQQLRSPNVKGLCSEVQFRLTKKTYLSGTWEAVHLSDNWTLNIDESRIKYGYGIAIGADTIIGPIKLSLSTPNFSNGYALKIDVGYHF